MPASLLYSAPLLLIGLGLAGLAAYVWPRRAVPGATALVCSLSAIAVWCIGCAFELSSLTIQSRLFWCKFELPGIALLPVFYTAVALQYAGVKLKTPALASMFVVPAAVILVGWTNEFHRLYWRRIWIEHSAPMPVSGMDWGPAFWVLVIYNYPLLALGFVAVLLGTVSGRLPRRQTLIFLASSFVPLLANIADVFRLLPAFSPDFTPFAFAVTGVGLTWVLFRYRFQAIVPVAWRTVVESMADAVLVLDPLGRILELNPAAERLLGASRLSAVGRAVESIAPLCPAMSPARQTGEVRRTDVVVPCSGRDRTCEVQMSPLRSRKDDVLGTLVMIRDVTAERAAARELEESKRAAEAGALAKSRFLANMSHEIRTPMNGILGMAGLLRDCGLNEEQSEYAETICNSAQGLLEVLNDILDFSKIEAGKLELEAVPFGLSRLLSEIVSLMRPSARAKGLELRLEAGRHESYVLGDPGRLRQVILNLIGNAIKFTPAGRVTVSLSSRLSGDGKIHASIAVADTGIGIPPDRFELLFHEFSQLDSSIARRHGGTGLGLAISHRLVAGMGGSIRVDSTPGLGSTFIVELDFATAPPREDLFSDQPELPTPLCHARCRILLAEDNAVNQLLGVRILEKVGCAVEVASNGEEAVRYAAERNFDLIIMDCEMPGMDGMEAAAELRRRGVETPIVALTASALEETRTACLEAGMNEYVVKPVGPEVWYRIIGQWVPAEHNGTGGVLHAARPS